MFYRHSGSCDHQCARTSLVLQCRVLNRFDTQVKILADEEMAVKKHFFVAFYFKKNTICHIIFRHVFVLKGLNFATLTKLQHCSYWEAHKFASFFDSGQAKTKPPLDSSNVVGSQLVKLQ